MQEQRVAGQHQPPSFPAMQCQWNLQGVPATHFHLLVQLLSRCIAQALEHRLPMFFAAALVALSEVVTTHQAQPAGAAPERSVCMTVCKGRNRLSYTCIERSIDGGADGVGRALLEWKTLVGISPAAVV
jgi:hypothetical protein